MKPILAAHKLWLATRCSVNPQGARAVLRGAVLRGAVLRGAVLTGADLRGAVLTGTDLTGADLTGADLTRAVLTGAVLTRAVLTRAKINWQSHDLIAYLLFVHARDDVRKRMVAGLILVSRDWCWDKFLNIEDEMKSWALGTLAGYITDDDGAPDCLRAVATSAPKQRR